MKIKNNKKGFTLIELLVVIAIISLLSSIVLASLKGARDKAIVTNLKSNISSLKTNAEIIRLEKGYYNSGIGAPLNTLYENDDCWTSGADAFEFIETSEGKNGKIIDELKKVMITGDYASCRANKDQYAFAFSVKPEVAKLLNGNKTICVDYKGQIALTNDGLNDGDIELENNDCDNI